MIRIFFYHFGQFFRFHREPRLRSRRSPASAASDTFHAFLYREQWEPDTTARSNTVIRTGPAQSNILPESVGSCMLRRKYLHLGRGIGRSTFHQNHIFVSLLPCRRGAARSISSDAMGVPLAKSTGLCRRAILRIRGMSLISVGSQLIGGHIHGFHKINSHRKIKREGEAFHS